jgi:multidrug resistance efflux pump
MSEPPSSPQPKPEAPSVWRPPPLRSWVIVAAVLLAVVVVLVVLAAWKLPPFGRGMQETDNAYVRGRTTVIASQVSGYIVAVEVNDYAQVAAGQILARVDDRPYRARVDQARANLDAARASLANNAQAHASKGANIGAQAAAIESARAQLLRAQADMTRVDDLVGDGSISVRERDQTLAGLRQAEAQVREAVESKEIAVQDLRSVDVGRQGLVAQVEAARAQLDAAQIDLEHSVIRAPEAGQLGEVGVRLGQYVTNGTQLMALVPPDLWVIANYKEAQTAYVAIGQRASFTVDAVDGARFTGHVERIAPATGSEFAVLKPDNATGNFVKVPQRIGIRIAIDPGQTMMDRLRPGMSVDAVIDTRSKP